MTKINTDTDTNITAILSIYVDSWRLSLLHHHRYHLYFLSETVWSYIILHILSFASLFHSNQLVYFIISLFSVNWKSFMGISILLDIRIFRIHGRFRLFKAFKTFQTEMKLPFFDPSLELFFLRLNFCLSFSLFNCFHPKLSSTRLTYNDFFEF